MKRIEKEIQKIEKVVTFISEDGQEFTSEDSCKKWEESYKGTLCAAFNKIPRVNTNGCDAYIQSGQPDDVAYILRPRNFEDIKVLNAYGKMISGCEPKLTQDDIGEVLIVDMGCCCGWFNVYNMKKYLKIIEKTYDNFIEELNSK